MSRIATACLIRRNLWKIRIGTRKIMMSTAVQAPLTATAPQPYEGFDTMLINGQWRRGGDGRVADDRDPYTEDVLLRIPLANERDLDDAFRSALAAQPGWCARLPGERA